MITPHDIRHVDGLTGEERLRTQKAMQQDDLSYLAALAFEQVEVSNEELNSLRSRIDQRSGGKGAAFQTVLIALFVGLFIGISVFFVIFHKNQTHPSVYQPLEPEPSTRSLNTPLASDTIFPVMPQPAPTEETEHFSSVNNQVPVASPGAPEVAEQMSNNPVLLPEIDEPEEDIILSFSPNAPVIFISNLKVTNYRLYYFRQNQAVDLAINTGVAAQYESKADIERSYVNRSENFLAHKIIQRAMKLFSTKHYANCIEELTMLYEFNKSDANAQFYLGMCCYLSGKYPAAQAYFQKNLDNENNIFHQESDFYQALCFLQTNQKEKGTSQLKSIKDAKGFYSTRAQEVLASMK